MNTLKPYLNKKQEQLLLPLSSLGDGEVSVDEAPQHSGGELPADIDQSTQLPGEHMNTLKPYLNKKLEQLLLPLSCLGDGEVSVDKAPQHPYLDNSLSIKRVSSLQYKFQSYLSKKLEQVLLPLSGLRDGEVSIDDQSYLSEVRNWSK